MNLVPEQPFWKRLVVAAVIFVACVAFVFLVGMLTPAEPQTMPPSKWDKQILELDKQALDEAYKAQVTHVFGIWVKDGVPPPNRAMVGFRNARKAYIDAMTEIEKREGQR